MTHGRPSTPDWQGAVFGPDGEPVGPLAPDEWVTPGKVEVDSDYLVPTYAPVGRAHGGPDLLAEFAALVDADAETIRRFASFWGMLGLCGHRMGAYHRNMPEGPALPELQTWPEVFVSRDTVGTLRCRVAAGIGHPRYRVNKQGFPNRYELAEPIEMWRLYVRSVMGLLDYTASGQDDLVGWLMVNQLVMHLTADSGVAPYIDRYWDRSRISNGRVAPARLVMGANNVLAAVTTQLLYAMVGGGRGLVNCSGCGVWFAPKRRPQPGAANWCPKCRTDGTANRHYAALSRARRRPG